MQESSPQPWVKSSKCKLSCTLPVFLLPKASWLFSIYRPSPLRILMLTFQESLLSPRRKEPLLRFDSQLEQNFASGTLG